jgi:hypothetical protein
MAEKVGEKPYHGPSSEPSSQDRRKNRRYFRDLLNRVTSFHRPSSMRITFSTPMAADIRFDWFNH